MDRLEMPLELSGRGIERDDRISKEVVTLSIEAIVITGWTAEDRVESAALRVHRHVEAPIVRACAILPAIGRPRVVAGFAWLRDRMKFPNFDAVARGGCACVGCW